MLLISETRDLGSEGKKREVLFAADINNVKVYAVDMSRFVEVISGKSQKPPRPDPMPATARQGTLPANVPATPTSVFQVRCGLPSGELDRKNLGEMCSLKEPHPSRFAFPLLGLPRALARSTLGA